MNTQQVYWLHNRTFILCRIGRNLVQGLVFEADGVHKKTLHKREMANMTEATYKGKPYPARKMRGHLRKVPAASKGAAQLRKEVLS